MFEYGEERVLNSLLFSMPRLRARATISALPFAVKRDAINEAYRYYVTDALMVISENTAALSKEGKCMSKRFRDITDPGKRNAETAAKSGDEIADEVIRRISGDLPNAEGEVKHDN